MTVPAEFLLINSAQRKYCTFPTSTYYYPRKPDQIRVVFDCSATFENESQNKHVLQAPDHLNSLIELLTRFRKEEVAFTCDIQQMFYSFYANPKDRNFLGFLWSENNDSTKPIVEYRMNAHFFGAASSPGVAAFCLHQRAETLREEFGRRFRPSPKRFLHGRRFKVRPYSTASLTV